MKKIHYLFFICVITLLSCNSNTIVKKPKNLIPKDKMVQVLTDVYIAKSAKNVNNIYKERNINYLSFIYKNHQIDSATFENSLKYYTINVSEHEEILKQVKENLTNLLNDASNQQKEEEELEMAKDSLNLEHQLSKDPELELLQ